MQEQKENLSAFFRDNSKLVKEYFEMQPEMYRLKVVRLISKSAGYFFWMIISAFLVFLFFIFLGVVVGLCLGRIPGSYIAGFALTAMSILVMIILMALLRNVLFVNPLVNGYYPSFGKNRFRKNKVIKYNDVTRKYYPIDSVDFSTQKMAIKGK